MVAVGAVSAITYPYKPMIPTNPHEVSFRAVRRSGATERVRGIYVFGSAQ